MTPLDLIALSLAWGPLRGAADLDARAHVASAIVSATDDQAEARTLMRLAWTESRFVPRVGRCARDVTAGGFFQVVGREPDEWRRACGRVEGQAALALERVQESRALCAHLPEAERLAVYARGSCASRTGRALSRGRVQP